MSKQDRQGARTATDLERRYNFGKKFSEVIGVASDAQRAAEDAKEAAEELDELLTSDEIFNRLTNNGALQGLYRGNDGELYINASYIKSGEFLADLIKAGVIRSKDGNGVVIDLDNGTAEITGSYKTVEQENDSGNIVSGELMPAWVRLITKDFNGNNVNFSHLTSHLLELGVGISKSIMLWLPEHNSLSDDIKLLIDDLDFGGIDLVVSPSRKSILVELRNGADGTSLQLSLKDGKVRITGLTEPIDGTDAVRKSYMEAYVFAKIDELRNEIGLPVG